MENPFKRSEKENMDVNEITPSSTEVMIEPPQSQLETVLSGLPEPVRNALVEEITRGVSIRLNSEKSETREIREEIVPPVITILTDIDKVNELTGEVTTKTDKWGFWIDHLGTKGRVFFYELPKFQFGHLGAIMPALKRKVYRYTYLYDKKGVLQRDENGSPIILKKERVHLAVELSNLKARINLAEEGYARKQQEHVIIGGVGQVDPYSENRLKDILDWGFGSGRKK